MKKAVLILAALATATAAFATAPAQAGGKRLHFGGPLGSFVASPHSGGSSHHRSSNHRKTLAAKKAAQRRAAARRAAARKAAAKKAAARKAYAKKVAAKKAAERKAAEERSRVAKAETKTDENTEWNAPVRASAIAGANTLAFNEDLKSDTAEDEEPAEETSDVETAEAAVSEDESTEVAELECKKYVPSAGMTITVPCGQ